MLMKKISFSNRIHLLSGLIRFFFVIMLIGNPVSPLKSQSKDSTTAKNKEYPTWAILTPAAEPE